MQGAAARFIVQRAARLEWSHLGDESVLFNPLSGQTHLLTILAIDILERLQESPATEEQLVTYLCDLYAIDAGTDFLRQVIDSLEDLQHLELIEATDHESR